MKSVDGNDSNRIQNLFFANKNSWTVLSEEREMELGWIIKRAREDLNREKKTLAEITQDVIKKIKGPVFDVDFGVRGCVDLHMEPDQENEFDTDSEDEKIINVPGNNPFNLDDEEMDIFELLTGERELRENDVIPDDELIKQFAESRKQFAVFRKRKKKADEAVRELAEGHMWLIVSIARGYKGKGVPFMELIQEGYKGAKDAAERFDPERKNKFSTYAGYWIKQRVRRAIIEMTREIRYPHHVADTLYRVKWAVNEIRHEANRKGSDAPTEAEIAALIEETNEKVQKMMNLPLAEMVLDAPFKDSEVETGMHDVLADEKALPADYLVGKKMVDGIMEKLLTGLRPFEREVIEKRFGLNGYGEVQTLAEIGGRRLSRERVRQVEEKVMKLLKMRIARIMNDNGIDRESFFVKG